jgi:hypothetical protein
VLLPRNTTGERFCNALQANIATGKPHAVEHIRPMQRLPMLLRCFSTVSNLRLDPLLSSSGGYPTSRHLQHALGSPPEYKFAARDAISKEEPSSKGNSEWRSEREPHSQHSS